MDLVSIVLCIARLCMLEKNSWFLFQHLQTAGVCYLYSGRSSVYFWYVVLCISMLACFGCDFLKCALILRADFACEEYLAWLSPKQVLFCFCFFVKLYLCFSGTRGNISNSWCVILLWFLNWALMCQNTFHYFDTEKSHTQSRCFVLSVFLSFCSSKATLFAFSGQRPAVKAPYQLLSMFPVTLKPPPHRLNKSLLFQMNLPHVTNTNGLKLADWKKRRLWIDH